MELAPAIVAKLRERARRFGELTEQLSRPEVASDGRRCAEIAAQRGQLESAAQLCAEFEELAGRRREAEQILSDAEAEEDLRELAGEELAGVAEAEADLDERVKSTLVSDRDDLRKKVIVEIRAGTGGDEATLFAADLYRMYVRFCDTRRWKIEQLEVSASEVGGFKEIIFSVTGEGSWRLLRFESGGHRVQRVPATESQGRIHTSAATVAVLPEAEEAEIVLKDEDLRIDTMRSSGPGGQSVNKTSSAVRITHLPTDTVVSCQDEKSQHKNKAKALRILKSRLLDEEQRRLHSERAEQRKSQVGSGDRSARVRTYNWPQNRVSDHRLSSNFSLEQIVAGKLGGLVEELEAMDREERIRNL
ncbi:MAG: peptide chain release factor 1 [Planctomycetes bacterium]|jgi:peptide chain release factor 1|nr:peptide chain release factor 1 [Planctomycetota bacterium]MDP6407794.1 peptide chain release factor 1 [Planctomycetota bacterium]